MHFIGITGGVGAGKSEILSYLAHKEHIRVMLADEIAHMLMQPGYVCYDRIREKFATEDIYEADGRLCNRKVAQVIFSDEQKRMQMNAIVHPAVRQYVLEQLQAERERKELSFLFLEAALLIEEHYDAICDELWYIYTSEDNRRMRLRASRGYSDAKITNIFASQLPEQAYREACRVVIDNNGTKEDAYEQIEEALRRKADEQ